MNVRSSIKHPKLSLFLCLLTSSSLFAYDQVKIGQTLPLAEKKMTPTLLRFDNTGQPWIYNQKSGSINKISKEGRTQQILKSQASGKDTFKSVADFVFTPKGTLFVADKKANKIVVMTSNLSLEDPWKEAKRDYWFYSESPDALALSQDDVIAVANNKEKVIHIFSIDGVLLHNLFLPGPSSFKKVVSLGFSRDGVLWVLDQGLGELHRFSNKRKWMGRTGGLSSPQDVVVDDHGYAYVSSVKGKWYEIDSEGKILGSFGTKGKKPGQMSSPHGLALKNNNELWVAEKGNRRLQSFLISTSNKPIKPAFEPVARIQIRRIAEWPTVSKKAIFNRKGHLLLFGRKKGKFEWIDDQGNPISSFGDDKNLFSRPVDMVLDQADNLWILDAGDHSIKKVSKDGVVEKKVGEKGRKEGYLKDPIYLVLRKDNSFLVVDKNGGRVQALGPDGLFLFAIRNPGKEKGQVSEVSGITINDERIGIIDNQRKALLFFDHNGNFLAEIANKENKAPIWADITGVATDHKGRFYVLDKGARRIRIFSPKGRFIADLSLFGEGLTLGPDGRILMIEKKHISIYQMDIVPKELGNLSAKDVEGIITVSWDFCTSCVEYELHRSSSVRGFKLLTKLDKGVYEDEDVRPGILYRYRVRGINSMGYKGNWTISEAVEPSRRKDISLVSLGDIKFRPIFSASYKTYVNQPIGEVEVRNNDDRVYRNVKLSLSIKKYTDFPTELVLQDLQPGERRLVPVTLTFNDDILELTENTPVQVELQVIYFQDNEKKKVSRNAPITLYSRNAIVWEDKKRISSFITPRDKPIVDLARKGISHFISPLKGSTVGKQLAKAALFYEAMNALEIAYVPDPNTPFAEAAGNKDVIDYIQFPRETLRHRTGDCDDTTALLSSLLESIGVETALVDTPNHIFLMANLDEDDPEVIGLPEERFVEFRGSLWVPIETTKLGQDFLEAWKVGMAQVMDGKEKGNIEFIPVVEASEHYSPVTLTEKVDEKIPFPKGKVEASFMIIMDKMQRERYERQVAKFKELMREDPESDMLHIRLGMAHVEGGKKAEGRKIFQSYVTSPDLEVRAAAQNNLGNLAYLNGNYKAAEKYLANASISSPKDGGILVNRARTAWKLGKKEKAKELLKKASKLLDDWREYVWDMPAEYYPK
ncbi:hypothetical protein BVX98_06515 [bacterium F11]|nr:hypothetical protein BVX98_06515 [bacterium F11]